MGRPGYDPIPAFSFISHPGNSHSVDTDLSQHGPSEHQSAFLPPDPGNKTDGSGKKYPAQAFVCFPVLAVSGSSLSRTPVSIFLDQALCRKNSGNSFILERIP